MVKAVQNYDNARLIKCQLAIKKWLFERYLSKIHSLLIEIIARNEKRFVHEPTLFGDNSPENIKSLEIAFKQRQKQMKEGEIAQIIFGNYIGWEDLGSGHPSGLDCRRKDNSIIMELKNKWNTCNSGSQEALLIKLSNYKKANPNTRCVWGIVNPKSGCKKLHEKIIYNGCVIEKIQGLELLKLVFINGDSDSVIQFVNKTIH